MTSILIRPALESEAAALSAIAQRAKAHWGYPRESLEAWRAELTIAPADVGERPFMVAMLAGQIAGFCSLAPSAGAWELDNLWVAPEQMGRGVGGALLHHALEAAKRAGARAVIVDSDPNAEAFYAARGGVRQGVVAAPIPGSPDRVRPQLSFALQ